MTEKIDRTKVLRFFTWTDRDLGLLIAAIACMIAASWAMYLGVALALKDAERAWILLYTTAAAAGFRGDCRGALLQIGNEGRQPASGVT